MGEIQTFILMLPCPFSQLDKSFVWDNCNKDVNVQILWEALEKLRWCASKPQSTAYIK